MRQEGILLRLVEAMHLVDEDHRGLASAAHGGCLIDGLANVFHSGQHGGKHDEVCPGGTGQQPRQRRLADTGRAPENH